MRNLPGGFGLSGKVGEALRETIPRLNLYQKLATIDCSLELDYTLDDLLVGESKDSELYVQFKSLGLNALIKQLRIKEPATKVRRETVYQGILTKKEFARLLERLSRAEVVAIDTETTSLNYMQAKIVGISVAITSNEAYYIPVMHEYDGVPDQMDRENVLEKMKQWLDD